MPSLWEKLVNKGTIDINQLHSATSLQRDYGGRIEEILVERRMVEESDLVEAISELSDTRRVFLDEIEPDAAARAKLPLATVEKELAFPVSLREESRTLWVALTDPTDLEAMDRISKRAGCRVSVVVAGAGEIRRAIARYYLGESFDPIKIRTQEEKPKIEEFSITDGFGNTVMTSMDVLRSQNEAAQAAAAASSAPVEDYYGDDDDDDDLFNIKALSPEEIARLEKLLAYQEKSSSVLRAITNLLVEKGIIGRDEIKNRTY